MTTKPRSTTEETLEPCRWCAQGDKPHFLDADGTLVSITGNDGILSHAYDVYWWPCLKFGVEIRCARISPASTAPVVDELTVYADGFCARCSELAYPLTRALEKTGVPTGADNWQQTYGPNKVRALADLETCLRRLLFALEQGKPEEITERITRANHYIEFHAEVRRRLTALAQERNAEPAAATTAPQHERLFEAKLLGFGEGDRIRLCEPCLKRATDEHLVSFSSALPAAPVAKSNREPHAFQEHPLYPNYCAFAVGDEDYCKRETDNVIHQVAIAAPVEQSDER